MARLESKFQSDLISTIKDVVPGSYILKNDANYKPGFPDLLVLAPSGKWAALEVKKCESDAAPNKLRPNQEYYVRDLNEKSYASFVYPENKEEVLDALQQALRA